jgi:hypothetical protein
MRRPWTITLAAAAMLAAALGAPTGDAGARPQAEPLPLAERVLRTGEFLGFKRVRKPAVVRKATVWAGPYGSVKTLRRDGFAGGVRSRMRWEARDLDALSVVARFRSRRAADRQLAAIVDGERLRIVGIPRAHGFVLRNGEIVGTNVGFTNGRYLYLVSAGWRTSHQRPVSIGHVADAARKLYRRVRGR